MPAGLTPSAANILLKLKIMLMMMMMMTMMSL